MVKKFLLGAALCSSCLLGSADVQASTTGVVVGARFGYGIGNIVLGVRKQGQDAKDQQEWVMYKKKNGLPIGMVIGYGCEIGKFYAGVEVNGGTDAVKFNEDKAKGEFCVSLQHPESGLQTIRGKFALSDGRVQFVGGVSILGGVKVCSNVVIGASLGVGVQHTRFNQLVLGTTAPLAMQNNVGSGTSHDVDYTMGTLQIKKCTLTSDGAERMKLTSFTFVGGVWGNVYLSNGMFVGARAEASGGVNRKLGDNVQAVANCTIDGTNTSGQTPFTGESAELQPPRYFCDATVHQKLSWAFRAYLQLGYKFGG